LAWYGVAGVRKSRTDVACATSTTTTYTVLFVQQGWLREELLEQFSVLSATGSASFSVGEGALFVRLRCRDLGTTDEIV